MRERKKRKAKKIEAEATSEPRVNNDDSPPPKERKWEERESGPLRGERRLMLKKMVVDCERRRERGSTKDRYAQTSGRETRKRRRG